MENLPLFYFFSSFIFFAGINLSLAADTISLEEFIQDGETLVSLGQSFELGFFFPGKSKNRYLGIWYKESPETVVWVANRNDPLFDTNGLLAFSDGNIVLLNGTKAIIWSSNVSAEVENPVAKLLDTGNLVISDNFSRNSSETYLWQSFDYPSDTLLPGMKLGWDLKSGLERYLTSWKSADDPSPGEFTYRLDIGVLPQISLYQRSKKMSRVGPWNGVYFGAIPTDLNLSFEIILVHNQDEIYYTYESFNNPIIMLLKLNQSGKVQRLIWQKRSSQWNVVFTGPGNFCFYYESCGANSVCSIKGDTPVCECLKGFKPKLQHNQTRPKTCVASSPLDCKTEDRFSKLSGIILPDLLAVSLNESMTLKECEAECLKNCSCRAYAKSSVDKGSGCLMWFGDLIDIRKTNGVDIYIRVPASEPGNKKLLLVVVIVIAPMLLVPAFIFLCYWRRKTKEKEKMETSRDMLLFETSMSMGTSVSGLYNGDRSRKGKSKDAWSPLFSFASVSAATNNFSTENKLGEGGFGPVYKGKLANGQEVAVKRLSRQSGQGLQELKNETMLIAKLQHRNLVRILGCCIEQGEKILIYEYMPNKSLDSFLFDPTKKGLLDWRTRVRIIEGIAQGLLYLHQYSRSRIIHRDLKASNILLDNNMHPKISDFGLARIFGGDELQANTKRIVGTFGYMSPEYVLEGLFSIKSDVFSFGILLLEIVSSKKNTGFYKSSSLNLLGYAWKLWKDDKAVDLMDPVLLENEGSYPILMRYINVALLCVQENAAGRPTMSEVVSMLTNELQALPSPKQPAFWYLNSSQNFVPPAGRTKVFSLNEVSISEIEAR